VILICLFQAGGILASSHSHTSSPDTELDENIYHSDAIDDNMSLLEQVCTS
jgi:hypothetical protein